MAEEDSSLKFRLRTHNLFPLRVGRLIVVNYNSAKRVKKTSKTNPKCVTHHNWINPANPKCVTHHTWINPANDKLLTFLWN